MSENVALLGAKRNDLESLVLALKQEIYKYNGHMTITEALGALEITKIELYNELLLRK
jgi:hypothetical protein